MLLLTVLVNLALVTLGAGNALAATERRSEIDLVLPDLSSVAFLGIDGHTLLLFGLVVCVARPALRPGDLHAAEEPARARVDARDLGADLRDLQDLPDHAGQVHPASSRLFIGAIIVALLRRPAGTFAAVKVADHPALQPDRHRRQLRRGLVRHPRQHVRQLAHRLRQPRGQALPVLRDPAAGRHEHRHAAHQRRAAAHAAASCSSSRATTPARASSASPSASRSAPSALRIAGGIFTKIADIGSDLMKIVFNIKEDDARNPGVIADCTGDNAGDSVGPSADGFETYGVTGVALISFILLAVPEPDGAGPAARLDLRDAHHDDRRERRCRTCINEAIAEGAVRERRQDELRGAADRRSSGSPRSSRSSSPTSCRTC